MHDPAQALVDEHARLERAMGDPAVASDPDRSRELGKRYAALGPTVAAHRAWVSARGDLQAARELAGEDASFAEEIPALEATLAAAEDRLDATVSKSAVLRYDAFNETSGRQSSTVALLDDLDNGVVFTAILQRDQARVYAKPIVAGRSSLDLSPEELAAMQQARLGPNATGQAQ